MAIDLVVQKYLLLTLNLYTLIPGHMQSVTANC